MENNKDSGSKEPLASLMQYEITQSNNFTTICKYIVMAIIAGIAAFWASTGHNGWGWLIFVLVLMT
jgi:hypothetical protein